MDAHRRRFRPSLHALLAMMVLVLLAACSSSDGGGGGAPVDPEAPNVGTMSPDELDKYLADNHVTKLEAGMDGVERGINVAQADGVARFYSPAKNGLFELNLKEKAGAVQPGLQVSVDVSDTVANYLIVDPTGKMAPVFFTTPVDGKDANLTVSAEDLYGADPSVIDYAEAPENPFAPKFTLIGISFTISINTLLSAALTSAAWMVFEKLISSTCTLVNPLYSEECKTFASWASYAGQVIQAGIPLALKFTWGTLGKVAVAASSKLVDAACGAAGKKTGQLLFAWNNPGTDPGAKTKDNQHTFRLAAYKLNYMLGQLDSNPPKDLQATEDALSQASAAMIATSRLVRSAYFDVYNNAQLQDEHFVQQSSFGLAGALVKDIVKYKVSWGALAAEPKPVVDALFHKEFTKIIMKSDVPIKSFSEITDGQILLDCVFAVAKEATLEYEEAGVKNKVDVSVEDAVGLMVRVLDERMDDIYKDGWGGTIEEPTCLPDLFEPNGTWQQAIANPFSTALNGSNTVKLDDLNHCAGDDDWYAFNTGPINLQVQSRIHPKEGGVGGSSRVCMEMLWYSQAFELAGTPPEVISGPYCGTVDSAFSTDQLGVARTTGETYSFALVHVYPDPAGGAVPAGGIDYSVEVKP